MVEKRGDIRYAHEKFSLAVYELAIGRGPIHERLESAYHQAMRITPEELPEDIAKKAADLRNRLTQVETKGDEGTLRATLAVMSEAEAVDIAALIFDIATQLEDAYRESFRQE